MSQHELILLSPYRYPGQYPLTLANEDMASWLNGFSVLWHPALLYGAKEPPKVDQPYDHEQPRVGVVYVLPESPPVYLPDDWKERVQNVGSVVIHATPDRTATLQHLQEVMLAPEAPNLGLKEAFELPADLLSLFFGLGWGHLLQATLAEAMEHENLLDASGFWEEVQKSIGTMLAPEPPAESPAPPVEDSREPTAEATVSPAEDLPIETPSGPDSSTPDDQPPPPETPPENQWLVHLQQAAQKLLMAREVLYPVAIHLLDLHLLDEASFDRPLPSSLELGVPTNFLASAELLEKLSLKHLERFELLKSQIKNGLAEVIGGAYQEREEGLLPLDSQLWNIRQGLEAARRLLDTDIRVYARKKFGFTPQTPLHLSTHGITKMLFLTFDDSAAVPTYATTMASWSSPDGKQVDGMTRAPKPAGDAETYFNLGHSWFKTTREDHNATLFLLHKDEPETPWFRDLMALHRLAPVLGTWNLMSRYLTEIMAGEYPNALQADDFHHDILSQRHEAKLSDPISAFPRHWRLRRRIDACWTFAALHRSLAGAKDPLQVEDHLESIERVFETQAEIGTEPGGLEEIETTITRSLADRLQSRAQADRPGYLLLNPCPFARRVALELEGGRWPLPIEGPVKACQLEGSNLRVVAEVPAFGFAWIGREGPPGTAAMASRIKLGDPKLHTIRNEFFEVEVDTITGGLKAIRDLKTRINRLGQQLVFNPGSRMVAREVKVTSVGPALGEIVSEGTLIGLQDQVFANFRQRFRIWLGRPLLEMRIEIEPLLPAAGYPWHAYFGSRFAWRDERSLVLRGWDYQRYATTHPRPQSPEYLDLRMGPYGTTIFTQGLPFLQKQENRMADVILSCEGESATAFELGISLDREHPMLTAYGMMSPLGIVPTTKGPPHIGASGWLFHLDMPNLLVTRLLPGKRETTASPENATEETSETIGPADAITAQMLECTGNSGHAEFRCVRNPKRAVILNGKGEVLVDAGVNGDAVMLEVSPNDWVQVQVEF